MKSRGLVPVVILALIAQAAGQDESPATARPSISMVRTETPPVIDGVLDDPAWQHAAVIDDFTQVEPIEGAAPTEKTVVYLLYDRDAIYVGYRCFDREPDAIIATTMIRDGDLGSDDRVRFSIGPFFDRRNGFYFEMNPVGARVDALVEDNDRLREDWDGIWYGKASIDAEGWVAEFAIPYKTMSINPGTTRWEFNTERIIRRRSEVARWAATVNNKNMRDIADAGILEKITDITQGLGLDIVPYVTGQYTTREDHDDALDFDGGLDLFKKLTPSTTLALTVNTDFAQTEVDARQINLTRFPLFFPEKRDFFLQDAGIFDFGGIRRNPLPFFSRRIGLAGGEEKDILAGARLTGREGGLNFGFMDVQMKEDRELGNKNLAVGRVALNVLDESTLGMIATAGDPAVRGDNYVVGADFLFRDSTWRDTNDVVGGSAWFLQSFNDNADAENRGSAFGAKIEYPNDTIDWDLGFSQIDEEFDPGLGFVSRRGIREYFGFFRYRWRPEDSWIRTLDVGARGFYITTVDDDVESEDFALRVLELETIDDDRIEASYSFEREVLFEPFEIFDDIVVPVGDYRFQRWSLELDTSESRPLSFGAEISGGDFFTGTRLETTLGFEWRLSSNVFMGAEYEQNDIDLDEGEFTTRLVRGRVNFFFTPDISLTNFVQYDNVSDSVGINSRLRWILEPGNEVFVVLNQGWSLDGSSEVEDFTQLTTKVTWTFRF